MRSCTTSAAPSLSAVRPPPTFSPPSCPSRTSHRIRKRGPRSYEARERRQQEHLLRSLPACERKLRVAAAGIPVQKKQDNEQIQNCRGTIPGHRFEGRDTASTGAGGQSPAPPKEEPAAATSRTISSARHFSVWFINARSVNGYERRGIIQHYLDMHDPDIFGITETWIDEFSCKHLTFPNYSLVHRRDRPGALPGRVNHGGIILYRRTQTAPMVTFIEESRSAERLWARVETDLGPFLLGLWYRPPNADDQQFTSLEPELERLSDGYVGTLLLGDFNIHQRRWLRYSSGNTPLGDKMQTLAGKYDLKELVKTPTHISGHLLDLVLSSLPFATKCSTTPRIADHSGVMTEIDVPVVTETSRSRTVWDFNKADWDRLQTLLRDEDWSFLQTSSVDEGTSSLTNKIQEFCRECIPSRVCVEKRSSHPWMTERCALALAEKAAAEGTDGYAEVCRRCGDVIQEEFQKYVEDRKKHLQELKPSSKAWWRICSELLDHHVPRAGLPSMRGSDGAWVHEPVGKSNLLAQTFAEKYILPPEIEDIDVDDPVGVMNDFVPLRVRATLKILKDLREDQATGPDLLGARVLRKCASQLARPLTVLARRILDTGTWPKAWKIHWISPLHKKGSVFDPSKYRGLHLTPVISKVVERILATPLAPFLAETCAYGRTQWAFQKKLGCKDLICVLVCRWLLAFQEHKKIGIYLSDISGAFDRVHKPRLLRKLQRAGLNDRFLKLFEDFLDVREAVVIVNGACSEPFFLENMVYQGTVFGPFLWNIFFADVSDSVTSVEGFVDTKFADDLSACKEFPVDTDDSAILAELRSCQTSVHAWGVRNRVSFDSGKEEFCILDANCGHGGAFRLLGPIVDPKLRMHKCVDKIYKRIKPKARRMLRARRFFSQKELVMQYKAHIWGIVESATPALYHAAPSVLSKLDGVQTSFVRNLGLTEREAFLWYGLHPMCFRRDVAMLGVLYKCAHGNAHPDLLELFPRVSSSESARRPTRSVMRMHSRQLLLRHHGTQRMEFHRSLFGLVKIWNALSVEIVESDSVCAFQRALTDLGREVCEAEANGWQRIFSPPIVSHVLLKAMSEL